MEDPKKPNELEEFDQFMGNTEEKMFQSLFPEMEEQEKSYLDIKNPSSRQPPGAQCGVMRAAATHTTSQAKHTRAVLLCRMQTTDCSSPGSERGPARIQGRGRSPRRPPTRSPRRSSRAASGAPVIKTLEPGRVDKVGYGDQYFVLIFMPHVFRYSYLCIS